MHFFLYNVTGALNYFSYSGSEDQIGIQTPSDTELVIQLDQPQTDLDALAELPIFSAFPSWASIGQTALTYFYGPYVIKEYVSSEKMTLVRNPFWPDSKELPQPVLEEIDFNLQPEQGRRRAHSEMGKSMGCFYTLRNMQPLKMMPI